MIGRKRELEIIRECREADRSRLIVVYGRRRVGKTFLVREAFDYTFTFTHTGVEDGSYRDQLRGFWRSLQEQGGAELEEPRNWEEAFNQLKTILVKSPDQRKVVFIDELPWMDTPRSGFVKEIAAFWNGWASARKDILLVVCGSAAAWMSNKILQNRGGLFNRANRTIYLNPFTLGECEQLLAETDIVMDRKDIVTAYMIFGGSPYYWSLLDRRESLDQNIDRLFFVQGATLGNEFRRLYRSVFADPAPYLSVVAALGTRKAGMTREELIENVKELRNDGTLSEILANLETSAFIRRYARVGKTRKGSLYQLIDNFTLFYFRFLKDYAGHDPQHWSHLQRDQHRVVWEGLAFERVCLLHSAQIKRALGISGVATNEAAWSAPSSELPGAQIDLVIERGDRVTNLCEMKFATDQYEISPAEAKRLREKSTIFKAATGTRNACHWTYVTTYGVRRTAEKSAIQTEVTLDDLFAI